ncbi:MAG: ABC transporter permease [Saccharofermentanales bacterium]
MKKHPYLYSCILIAVVWELAHLLISRGFFPPPLDTAVYFVKHIPVISVHLLMSFMRIVTAIIITILTGAATGIFTARNAKADSLVSPLLYTLYPVPKIAFLPLLMLFFGLGNGSKIALVSLILYFQIAISTRDSVKNVHPAYFISIKSLGATGTQVYRHVILPAILPNLFTALRISVGTSISVLFFAENFATRYGIGYYIMDSWLRLDYTAMFAGIIAISVMGSVLFKLIDYAELAACRWNRQ